MSHLTDAASAGGLRLGLLLASYVAPLRSRSPSSESGRL